MRSKSALLVATFLLLIAALADAASVAEIKARKKLIVLSHPDPLGFLYETAPGKYDGLDVAIMKTLSNDLGVALEIKALANFKDLIPALLDGQGDVIASSMTITKEREKLVSFSDPYFPVVMMIVVPKNSNISKEEDLTAKKCSLTLGTIMEDRMKSVKGVQFVDAEDSTAQFEAVSQGKADFAVFDSSSAIGNIHKYPDLKMAFHFPEHFDYGFAVPQNSDLRDAINRHLKDMNETGALRTMIRRYLGDRAFELLELIKD
ncbi:MAG TPA: transporter substrate-binding domain-containing protein [Acidobacteriota bacterium]|nr:transporter substrate-binding domain-containing protein [Acidobacteriota bacterium]